MRRSYLDLQQDIIDAPLLFRQQKERGASGSTSESSKGESEKKEDHAIVCKSCGQIITTGEQKIVIDSTHQHTFFNPAGILFEIGCFAKAQGCATKGPKSDEFSWFAGTLWTPAVCVSCFLHLGWLFEKQDGSYFYGLILLNLVEK